jgi:hypothetical protein
VARENTLSSKPPAFLSYARVDLAFARRLAADLKAAGANVWLDKLDIRPGRQWDKEVEKALTACTEMLVILSSASVASRNVMDEVSFALEEGKTVIPVIQGECEIPFRLRRLQRVDFSSDYELGLKALLDALFAEKQMISTVPATRGAAAPTIENQPDQQDESRQSQIQTKRAKAARKSAGTPTPRPPTFKPSLFPLYGIVLGKSTKDELAKLGRIGEAKPAGIFGRFLRGGRFYKYKNVNFFYDEDSGLVNRICLNAHIDLTMPAALEDLGFRWKNSYQQWLALLKNLGYTTEVKTKPHIEGDSFTAEVIGRIMIPHPHRIELDFGHSDGTKSTSAGTLLSIDISAD